MNEGHYEVGSKDDGGMDVYGTVVHLNLAKAPFSSNPYASGPAPVPVDFTVSTQHSIHFSATEVQDLLRAKRQETRTGTALVAAVGSVFFGVIASIATESKAVLFSCVVLTSGLIGLVRIISKRRPRDGGPMSKKE